MARSSGKAVVAKTTGTAVALIDQEMATAAASLKSQLGQASGNKIKVETTGDFILPDGLNLGPEIQVIVVDSNTRHSFYSTIFDKNNPTPPDCYAMSEPISRGNALAVQNMKPEKDSPSIQHTDCASCPLNAFKSGHNGKSKACKNERLLAVLVIDPNDPDAHNAADAPIYALSIPPTQLKHYDAAANAVQRMLNGPPIKAVLTVTGKNVGTYSSIEFSAPVPNPDYAQHWGRRSECEDILFRRPDFAAAAARQSAAPARGRGAPVRRR